MTSRLPASSVQRAQRKPLRLLIPAVLCAPLAWTSCRQPGSPTPISPSPTHSAAADPQTRASRATLFIAARVQNTTEPCGCTSDPLGDVARVAALVRDAGPRGLLLDAGGLRYKPTVLPPEKVPQARLKADFLEATWRGLHAVSMLQTTDLQGAQGAQELSARLVSNVDGLPADRVLRESIREVNGLRIGVLGLASPTGSWPAGIQVQDPVQAGEKALTALRQQGATITVALTGLARESARKLARRLPDLDLVVAGGDDAQPDGVAKPELLGKTLLVVPAVEAQRLIRIDIFAGQDGSIALNWRPTESQRREQIRLLREQFVQVDDRLRVLRADSQAEPAFVAATEAERARLQQELASAERSPTSDGAYATAELIAVSRSLRRDPATAQAMQALDRQIGEANLKAAAPSPPPIADQPYYVGAQACQGACHFHDDAFAFWQKTRHAQAFNTLVHVGKELSYDCVGCHAVAFEEAGGSGLRSLIAWQRHSSGQTPPTVADLRNIQCETCHGPGSAHITRPSKNPIPTAKPDQNRCLVCHTKEHSDTFEWQAYLRDILGPGHGADRRAALPPGPTGHELRSAALKARGQAVH